MRWVDAAAIVATVAAIHANTINTGSLDEHHPMRPQRFPLSIDSDPDTTVTVWPAIVAARPVPTARLADYVFADQFLGDFHS